MQRLTIISVTILLVGLIGTWAHQYVHEYEEEDRAYIEDETESLLDLLSLNAVPERFRPEQYFIGRGTKKVQAFSYKNCDPSAVAQIQSLSVTPDPLQFPGNLNIDIKLAINSTVDAVLPASLIISKKVAGIWIKLPCVDNFGSCNYDDLCELLSQIGDCPDPIVKTGLGCQCPFKAGTYQTSDLSFEVDAAALPSGDYNITGSISHMGKPAGCLELILTVA
ncbi:hypothetical protein FSP39_006836 [Pinctada imbricata]|uniref:MD-2-related lipid-recognition domain-containing protein n=1 Tax=Pinctada imbricata TaxID=66713 RepID=A0AA88YHP1_PINIB|nr:hypothetical protein FSP39_006836 [Pinctada imbricata]